MGKTAFTHTANSAVPWLDQSAMMIQRESGVDVEDGERSISSACEEEDAEMDQHPFRRRVFQG